jgi:hypothetical protein
VAFVIDANLDCEAKWSGLALGKPILERISYYGTLLAVLAPKGEPVELWTPVAIDTKRARLGVPTKFRVGTPAHADLRWADPAAKAANDRRLAHGAFALPGSFVLASVDTEHAWPASWVAKAVWSAAGRDRCRGNGPPNTEQRTRLARLLAACGALVVEPWCERVLDAGVLGTVDTTGEVTAEAPHGVIVDPRGGFLGIEVGAPALERAEQVELERAIREAGQRLANAGYAGPFGIDAFVHVVDGQRAVHVCEINARYSFGWIARAFARRTGSTRLGFGSPQDKATILIEDREDHITVWIA